MPESPHRRKHPERRRTGPTPQPDLLGAAEGGQVGLELVPDGGVSSEPGVDTGEECGVSMKASDLVLVLVEHQLGQLVGDGAG